LLSGTDLYSWPGGITLQVAAQQDGPTLDAIDAEDEVEQRAD
jgi:hypothetical protein